MAQLIARKKVKTGCKTCRARKVKCDEAKPACVRCQRAGRSCEGYGIWGGGDQAEKTDVRCQGHASFPCISSTSRRSSQSLRTATIPNCNIETCLVPRCTTTSVALLHLDAAEQKCFDWYMNRSVKKLPGAFRSESWTAILFQAGTIESPVLYSMLTLASAHREEVKGLNTEVDDEQTLLTYREYSKAIRHLRCGLQDKRTALMSIPLLVSTEFLRGHYTSGLIHLQHGIKILETIDNLSTYLDGWLITSLARLLIQAKLLGQLHGVTPQILLSGPLEFNLLTFRSPHHARRTLESLLFRMFELRETYCTAAEKQALNEEMQRWVEVYHRTLLHKQELFDYFAYWLLRIHSRTAIILIGTLGSPGEMASDSYERDFFEIISRSIEGHRISHSSRSAHHDPEPTSPNSVCDVGWIPPLYLTATKCRNHRLRHQAVKLLKSKKPHKEGIWSTRFVIAIAQKVIELEEGDFYQGRTNDDYDPFAVATPAELCTEMLPESRRISDIDIVLPDDRVGRILVSCRKGNIWINLAYDLKFDSWSLTESVTNSPASGVAT